jgi:hypothetical protein
MRWKDQFADLCGDMIQDAMTSETSPDDMVSVMIDGAPGRVAFRPLNGVGTQDRKTVAARWLAYALPYRRFAPALTSSDARLVTLGH